MIQDKYKLSHWLLFSLSLTVFFLMLNWLAGHIFLPNSQTSEAQYRDLGAAFAIPVIGGFCMSFLPVLKEKAQTSVLESSVLSGSSLRYAELYIGYIGRIPRTSLKNATICSVLISVTYMWIEDLFYVDGFDLLANLKRWVLILETFYLWGAVFLCIISVYRMVLLIIRFIDKHLKVELFYIEELIPLAKTVIWNTVFFSIALSLTPLFWVGRKAPVTDLVLIMGFLFLLLILLFFPIFRVRNIITKKKNQALERVKTSLKIALKPGKGDHRRLTDDSQKLTVINNLIVVRDEISHAKEWPLNIPIALKFLGVILIPPMTWLADKILSPYVEKLIKFFS